MYEVLGAFLFLVALLTIGALTIVFIIAAQKLNNRKAARYEEYYRKRKAEEDYRRFTENCRNAGFYF